MAVGLAADLHLSAALPVARSVESLTPAPYIEEIITEAFKVGTDSKNDPCLKRAPVQHDPKQARVAIWMAQAEPGFIGPVNQIPLRLQGDIEDDKTLSFKVGPASRPLVRYSIHGQDIQALADATQQAVLDLE